MNHDRVHFDLLDVRHDDVHVLDGVPFSGIAYDTFADGSLRSEMTFIDGVENGLVREWNSVGLLIHERHNRQGGYDGIVRTWHSNGSLKSEALFELGIEKTYKEWNEQGAAILERILAEDCSQYRTLVLLRQIEAQRRNAHNSSS